MASLVRSYTLLAFLELDVTRTPQKLVTGRFPTAQTKPSTRGGAEIQVYSTNLLRHGGDVRGQHERLSTAEA